MSTRSHREQDGLGLLLCMGLFSRFFWSRPSCCLQIGRASSLIPRCSERVVVATFALVDIPSQFLLSATAAQAARFSPLADVLTFLRLPLDRPKLRLSTSKTK